MILTEEQTKHIMGETPVYSCELVKKRFSYYLFRDKISPFGNIIAFEYPTKIGALDFGNSLVLAIEIPNSNIYGGVCFQRLYAAQLGSLFAQTFEVECYVDGNNIIVQGDTQANISILNRVKDSMLMHFIFSLDGDNEGFYKLSFNQEKMDSFKQKAVECFTFLAHSIFVETQHDNF